MPGNTGSDRGLLAAVEPAHGFFDLGLYNDAWAALDDLLTKDKADPAVISLRLDILLALHRLDDAVALGSGACRQWPSAGHFFAKTAAALIALDDHEKAKALLLAAPSSLKRKAAYWYDLARCQARTGETMAAKKSLGECFKRDKSFRAAALDEADLEPVWRE
jgi:predicted Zn-dependent protease